MTYLERDDWNGDRHRGDPEVHYRLYLDPRSGEPAVICVQDFDYPGYDARCILDVDAWDTEALAEQALMGVLPLIGAYDRRLPATLAPAMRARMLAAAVRGEPATSHATRITSRDVCGHLGWECTGCTAEASGFETAPEVIASATAHGPLAADSPIPADDEDYDV